MKPLHHKKHPLAKRGLSLLCVLALCLGLLPATALAAGRRCAWYTLCGPDTNYRERLLENQLRRHADHQGGKQ